MTTKGCSRRCCYFLFIQLYDTEIKESLTVFKHNIGSDEGLKGGELMFTHLRQLDLLVDMCAAQFYSLQTERGRFNS